MLMAIALKIIKLMPTYSPETHQYGGCNISLTKVACLPNLVKISNRERGCAHKTIKFTFFLDSDNIFIVSNKIDVYMSTDSAFVYNFLFN